MASAKERTQIRKKNRERKDYFRQYYSGEIYEKQKKDMRRRMIMAQEAGRSRKNQEKRQAKKNKALANSKRMIVVEGQKVFKAKWALRNLVHNLKYDTLRQYIARGIIPKPVLVRKTAKGHNRYYLSQRQIRMLNTLWHKGKKKKKKSLKEKSEYLWANWLDGNMGL